MKSEGAKEKRKLQEKIKKKRKPTFRGHFGKRSVRRKSKEKWDKWRVPRGADFHLKKEDGKAPSTGYRTSKEIRGLHPSGYRELLVHNVKDVENAKQGFAIRIASAVGKKKREQIIKRAHELKIKVLNE
jgi:large subunit ribosomal protein L32e